MAKEKRLAFETTDAPRLESRCAKLAHREFFNGCVMGLMPAALVSAHFYDAPVVLRSDADMERTVVTVKVPPIEWGMLHQPSSDLQGAHTWYVKVYGDPQAIADRTSVPI